VLHKPKTQAGFDRLMRRIRIISDAAVSCKSCRKSVVNLSMIDSVFTFVSATFRGTCATRIILGQTVGQTLLPGKPGTRYWGKQSKLIPSKVAYTVSFFWKSFTYIQLYLVVFHSPILSLPNFSGLNFQRISQVRKTTNEGDCSGIL